MMVNSINEPYYHAGFAAIPYDYIRFANYILKRMKKNDCFGNYLKKATNKAKKTQTLLIIEIMVITFGLIV